MSTEPVRLLRPPQPTLLDPLAQINWIFFQLAAEYESPTKESFISARNKYIEFVVETNARYEELKANKRFFLSQYWEADALIRFTDWLLKQGLAGKTVYSYYKLVRQVMDMAYALRVIDTVVHHPPVFKGVSETDQRSPYSEEEQEVINASIARWIGLADSVLRGYKPTGKGIPYRRPTTPSVVINDQKFFLEEAADRWGVRADMIYQRTQSGWTAEEAVGLLPPPAHQLHKGMVIQGVAYSSMEQICKTFGIKHHQIRRRQSLGWTPEQIVGVSPPPEADPQAVRTKRLCISIDGVDFESLEAAAQHYGVPDKTFQQRLYGGWTPRQAAGIDQRDSNGVDITVEGTAYPSISAAAAAYGVQRETVGSRLRKGHTPEQAVGIQPIYVLRSDERALLWMFENEYGCDARTMWEDFQERRNAFTHVLTDGRLRQLFMRWGVWPYVDDRLIMPLAVEFNMLTGLNVEALKLLEIDSYQAEHLLTGQPVISYRKKRGASSTRSEDRELHIPFLEIEELPVDPSVGQKLEKLIGLIINLTAKIRCEAPPEIARRLFIFEYWTKTGDRVVLPLDPHGVAGHWYRRFKKDERLDNLFGNNFHFNLARCRPTLATNMVLAGASLHQVQSILGHGDIQTTATYLDEQGLRPKYNVTMSKALQKIAERSREVQSGQGAASSPGQLVIKFGPDNFHETLSGCGCHDPYNPSSIIRKITNYVEGTACRNWNMCLRCDESVVTEKSLPKLILYRMRIQVALDGNSPAIAARRELLGDIAKMIDGILMPDFIFRAETIADARRVAVALDDLLVDQLIYQGIQ